MNKSFIKPKLMKEYNPNNLIEYRIDIVEKEYYSNIEFSNVLNNYKASIINMSNNMRQFYNFFDKFYDNNSIYNSILKEMKEVYKKFNEYYFNQINNLEEFKNELTKFNLNVKEITKNFDNYFLYKKTFKHYYEKLRKLNLEEENRKARNIKSNSSKLKQIERVF